MKIDLKKAAQVLEEEVHEARSIQMTGQWVERVKALSKACAEGHKTMIAALGTALLAKATHLEVDPFSLRVGKDKEGPSYSARNLAKNVLAQNAKRLAIDLGATGPEPLNNQPFFHAQRISRKMGAHANAKPALAILCDALEALAKVRTEKEARTALRAFLFVRELKKTEVVVEEDLGDNLYETDLLKLIQAFVGADSEGGKRAQAVAAGLLDAMMGRDRVRVGRVNDPSRNMPGDVGITEAGRSKEIERVFEVKDKPVTAQDISILVDRVRAAGISKVGIIAVAKNQDRFDTKRASQRAEGRGIRLGVYFGWESFVKEVLFWSKLPRVAVGPAYRAINDRLADLEVSELGRTHWLRGATGDAR